MRAIWKGSITFGLVNVPIAVHSATSSHDLRLHQVHNADGGRIRYQRRCEVCGEGVEWGDIDKAYDAGERTVVLTDDVLAELPTEKSREIEILQFVPSEQIDPIMMAKSYYLAPTSSSPKSYTLLLRTLEETDRTAVVSFTLRQRTQLGALRVRDGVLVLQALLWADEVREPEFAGLGDSVRISAKELEMSAALVENFSGDFDPEEFTDDYQEQLRTLVEAKLEEGEGVDTEATFGAKEEEAEDAEVLDLMEALRRSVSDAKKRKTSSSSKSASGKSGSAKSGSSAKSGPSSSASTSGSSRSTQSGSSAKSGSSSSSSKSGSSRSTKSGSSAKTGSKSGSSSRSSSAKPKTASTAKKSTASSRKKTSTKKSA